MSNEKKYRSRGLTGGVICAVIFLFFVSRREGESGGCFVACYMAPAILFAFAIIGFFIADYFKPYE